MLSTIGFVLALFMGITLGLLGAGGSILTVPILVYFFNVPAVTATAYSLLIVGVTAFIGGLRYYKAGQIDLQTSLFFAIPSLIGVYLTRAFLVPAIPDPIIDSSFLSLSKDSFILLLFSVLMVSAALLMLKSTKAKPKEKRPFTPSNTLIITVEGLLVGAFTGLVGAGGGFMIIPALVLLAGLSMTVAVGSSLFIIAVKSLIGIVGDLQAGLVLDWQLLFPFLGFTVVGMIGATHYAKHIPQARIKTYFSYFILLVAAAIVIKEI